MQIDAEKIFSSIWQRDTFELGRIAKKIVNLVQSETAVPDSVKKLFWTSDKIDEFFTARTKADNENLIETILGTTDVENLTYPISNLVTGLKGLIQSIVKIASGQKAIKHYSQAVNDIGEVKYNSRFKYLDVTLPESEKTKKFELRVQAGQVDWYENKEKGHVRTLFRKVQHAGRKFLEKVLSKAIATNQIDDKKANQLRKEWKLN